MTATGDAPHVRPYSDVPITLTETGDGPTVLVLHGGGGPITVAPLAEHLSGTGRVLTPTHPGWNGTPRPDWFDGIADLALAYLALLADRGPRDVLVVGSSIGGWIAAEMAVRDRSGIIGGLILIDAVGVWIDDEPIRDFFALDPRGVAEFSYHDARRFSQDPADIPVEQLAARQANMAALRLFAGDPYMHDPDLFGRLATVSVPALLLWGESDRIATPAYGAAYASAFTDGRLETIPEAGHLPHIEQPEATFAAIDSYRRALR
jgi:pimeloyl-ACP methyl ester carboxylesterase